MSSIPTLRHLMNLVESAGVAARDPRSNSRFRAWFGDSKVVDAEGKPLVLFHGTAADIQSFKGTVWASVTPALANEYAAMRDHYGKGGGNVMPVFMRIERPFNADLGLSKTVKIGEFFGAVMEQAVESGVAVSPALRDEATELLGLVRDCARREESGPHYDRHNFWLDPASSFGSDGAQAIRRLFSLFGFDGVQMIEGGELTFGAFSSEQVKSVFNSNFEPTSTRVSEAGFVGARQGDRRTFFP